MNEIFEKFVKMEGDNIKPVFKYYKRKKPPPDLTFVLDPYSNNEKFKPIKSLCSLSNHTYLKDSEEWQISFLEHGIHIIHNPFSIQGIAYWTLRCLKDFSQSVNNLKNPHWWSRLEAEPQLVHKLRWATLGYHHDWDTKEYQTDQPNWQFPEDLSQLCQVLLGQIPNIPGSGTFQAEAAIVNFYPMDATLSGHKDFSEPNKSAPLVSISLGQSAIFLIGGPDKSQKPEAIILRSGDVLIMSHRARQSFHAVPKILPSSETEFTSDTSQNEYLKTHRININIRQVF